jgi:hypothetical protein
MPQRVAMQAARWIGLFVALIGLIGFVHNPIVGSNAAVESDMAQNVAHIVIGLYLVGVSFTGESASAFSLYIVAILCMLFAGLAYHELGSFSRGQVFNSLWVNRTGAYFHGALSILMVACGKMNTASKQLFYN